MTRKKPEQAKLKRFPPHSAPKHRDKIVHGERLVEDPFEPGAKVKARVNLAEHPLEMMRARGRLDDAQYEAGVRFRAIFEQAAIGPGRGLDPARIRVDGGRQGEPLTDAVLMAHADLAMLARELGMVGFRIMQAVAGQGVTVSDLATRWPGSEMPRAKRDYVMLRFKEALDLLALDVWGARGPAGPK